MSLEAIEKVTQIETENRERKAAAEAECSVGLFTKRPLWQVAQVPYDLPFSQTGLGTVIAEYLESQHQSYVMPCLRGGGGEYEVCYKPCGQADR